jgi:uncharacterized protein YgbK (DUF1537 family)
MNILELSGHSDEVGARLEAKLQSEQPDVMLFDVLDEDRLHRVGELILQEAEANRCFVVGSSGVEYALTAVWQARGLLETSAALLEGPGGTPQLLAISGSCSPVTRDQIEYALDHGFVGLQVPVEAFINKGTAEEARGRLRSEARRLLEQGKDVVIYTALGPEDTSISHVQGLLREEGVSESETSRRLGQELGKLSKELITDCSLKRVLIAGGDTSGYVSQELGITALEIVIPIAPGGPLCKGYSSDVSFNGIEISLKGGQVGHSDYFIKVKQG